MLSKRPAQLAFGIATVGFYMFVSQKDPIPHIRADIMPLRSFLFNRTHGERKRTLFQSMRDSVLELGPGSGANFRYLPSNLSWDGVESNKNTKKALLAEASQSGFSPGTLILHHTDMKEFLQNVPNDSVDNVLTTEVLCTMSEEDVRLILKDIYRVLKRDGRYYFIERTRQTSPLSFLQDLLTPIRRLIDGSRLNVPIAEAIFESGFGVHMEHWPSSVDQENTRIGIELVQCLRGLENRTKCTEITGIHGISPLIAGYAKKPGAFWDLKLPGRF